MPAWGVRPDAIANAIARGKATKPTVMPAIRSSRNLWELYVRKERIDFGSQLSLGKAVAILSLSQARRRIECCTVEHSCLQGNVSPTSAWGKRSGRQGLEAYRGLTLHRLRHSAVSIRRASLFRCTTIGLPSRRPPRRCDERIATGPMIESRAINEFVIP